MKKMLSMLLAIVLILTLTPAGALIPSADAATDGGYTYEVYDGKATITGCTLEYNYFMEIPQTVDGYPVVSIGKQAFQECNNLLEVTIPEGVETIEGYAFYQCFNLTWVYLPDSLKTIGKNAFCNCKSLEVITFGTELRTIEEGAFSACRKLDFYLDLPDKLEVIGTGAFYNCDSLKTVMLPDSLQELGSKAFAMCNLLEYVHMPDGIRKIGAQLLYQSACYYYDRNWYWDGMYIGSYFLEAKKNVSGTFRVAGGVSVIADSAFENCYYITEVVLWDGVEIIGSKAFYNCDMLERINIPDSVTTIGDKAFYYCESLNHIEIPASVTCLGEDVFTKSGYYNNAENWDNNAFYAGSCLVSCKSPISGSLQVREGTRTIAKGAVMGQHKLEEVILPDSLTEIGEQAFNSCSALKAVHLGKHVEKIGNGAFGNCKNLEIITVDQANKTYYSAGNCVIQTNDKVLAVGCKGSRIPADGSVTGIGDYAFEGCAGLTEITIPDTIQTIGVGAFQECDDLVKVSLGNGVQVVGSRAFAECDLLALIDLGERLHTIEDYGFAYNHQIEQIAFPASLQHLGEEAFSNNSRLKTVSFSEGLLSIGKNCFVFCESLTSLHLPDSLEQIRDGAFYCCENITTLTLGSGLEEIGSTAFSACESLTEVTIPAKVHTIGSSAFFECTRLQKLDLGQVQKIEYSAFESCVNLKEVHIPQTVTTMGRNVFSYCAAIEKMTVSPQNLYYQGLGNCIIRKGDQCLVYGCKNSVIPADGSVTAIDSYAFAGCRELESIVVPDSVTRIGAYAFYECWGIAYMQIPFVGGESAYDNWLGFIFGASTPSQNDLYVPKTLKEIVITGGNRIGASAFCKCTGLQEVTLPESILTISDYAFQNCEKLKTITLGSNLTKIGTDAFYYCFSLQNVYYTGSADQWANIAIGSGNYRLTSCTIIYNSVSVHRHSFTNYVSDNNATYVSDGTKTAKCDGCDATNTITDVGSQLPIPPQTIVIQPTSATAQSGESVIFPIVVSGNVVSYQWQYRKVYKWFDTTLTGYNTDMLTVTATGARNGYDYRCVITFADGTVLYSEPAKLTVNTVIDITNQPDDQTVVLGSKGQFTVEAQGEGLKYQWEYRRPNGNRWIETAMEGATRQTVYIESTTGRDGYQYRCKITDAAGKIIYTEPATMRVLSFKSHPGEVFAVTGSSVQFTVTTSVTDGFTYQWQYRRNATASWTNTTMTGYNTATLTVDATKARDGYQYRCVLTGSKNAKIESKAAVLHVDDPA